MAIFLLWFSIFSFTVFTVALVICVFRFLRSRQFTQGLYLLLVLVFDLWLLTFTYLFFTDVYLRPLSSGARMALGLARMLVSAVILYFSYLAAVGVYANIAGNRNQGTLPENLRVFLRFSTVALRCAGLSRIVLENRFNWFGLCV